MGSAYSLKILDCLATKKNQDLPKSFKPTKASKLSFSDKNAYSQPAGLTCPGKTKACDGCYAMNGNHLYPSVHGAYTDNYLLFESFRETNNVSGCADKLLEIVPSIGNFRIHESGDFHCQFSIDVWDQVISQCRKTQFWAYTRSFDLDFSEIVKNKNFRLWASTDRYNWPKAFYFAKELGINHAYGPWDNPEIPQNSFVCPSTGTGKLKGAQGACQICRLCFEHKTTKNVVFIKH